MLIGQFPMISPALVTTAAKAKPMTWWEAMARGAAQTAADRMTTQAPAPAPVKKPFPWWVLAIPVAVIGGIALIDRADARPNPRRRRRRNPCGTRLNPALKGWQRTVAAVMWNAYHEDGAGAVSWFGNATEKRAVTALKRKGLAEIVTKEKTGVHWWTARLTARGREAVEGR